MSQVIGRYLLQGELGRGTSGVVFRAWDPQERLAVALKLLPAATWGSEELARAEREVQAALRLRHPHLVPLLDQGMHEGRPFLVWGLVAGRSLEDELRQRSVLDPRRAARIARDVARGLAHAHAQGVVHRDVKPANVLLESERALLGDFGLARLMGTSQGSGTPLTREGEIVGTPLYMSPEQALGAAEVGPASDVYGLGGVLYTALTGRAPVAGTSVVEVLERVLRERPPAPRELRPELDPALEALCLRCLARDPQDRPSAEELVRVLDAWLRGRAPVRSRPPLALLLGGGAVLTAVGFLTGLLFSRAPAARLDDPGAPHLPGAPPGGAAGREGEELLRAAEAALDRGERAACLAAYGSALALSTGDQLAARDERLLERAYPEPALRAIARAALLPGEDELEAALFQGPGWVLGRGPADPAAAGRVLLDALAGEVAIALAGSAGRARAEQLVAALLARGVLGHDDDAGDPAACDPFEVLEHRRGSPLARLALTRAVARRVGVSLAPILAPGLLALRWEGGADSLYLNSSGETGRELVADLRQRLSAEQLQPAGTRTLLVGLMRQLELRLERAPAGAEREVGLARVRQGILAAALDDPALLARELGRYGHTRKP